MPIPCFSAASVSTVLTCVALATTLDAQSSTSPSVPSDRILAAVDVELTHGVVDRDGTAPWPIATRTAFRLQKVRTRTGETKITIAYRPTAAANRTRASSTPLDGARVEYDTSQRRTSVFDEGGRRFNPRLSMAPPGDAALGSFESWLQALVVRASDAPGRRRELERTHGRPVGVAGRLNRYRQVRDDVSEEVLADASWVVPVEVTVQRRGGLDGRLTFEYSTTPAGHLVRRRMRSEQVVDPGTGRRAVLSAEFSNIVVEGW
jgi:hypothetical protein